MKYVPNLIPDEYFIPFNSLSNKDSGNNNNDHKGLIIIGLLLFGIILFIIISNQKTPSKNITTDIKTIDSSSIFIRRDSLNKYRIIIENQIGSKKLKTAIINCNKALEFATSSDSQYLFDQISKCKARLQAIARKKQLKIDTSKTESQIPIQSPPIIPEKSLLNNTDSSTIQVSAPHDSIRNNSNSVSKNSNSTSENSYKNTSSTSYSGYSGHGTTYVHGYYRKDGTYVSGHTRRSH
jgi:hypothetical protein